MIELCNFLNLYLLEKFLKTQPQFHLHLSLVLGQERDSPRTQIYYEVFHFLQELNFFPTISSKDKKLMILIDYELIDS